MLSAIKPGYTSRTNVILEHWKMKVFYLIESLASNNIALVDGFDWLYVLDVMLTYLEKKTMAELCTLSQSVNTSGSIDLTVLNLIGSSYGVNSSLYRGSVSYCFTSLLLWWLWKLKATINQFLIWLFNLYKFHSYLKRHATVLIDVIFIQRNWLFWSLHSNKRTWSDMS